MNNEQYAQQVGLAIKEQITLEQFTRLWENSNHDNVVLVRQQDGIIQTRFHAKHFWTDTGFKDYELYSFSGGNIGNRNSFTIKGKLLEVTFCEKNIYLLNFGDTKIAVRLY